MRAFRKKIPIYPLAATAVCTALCVVLPLAFHFIPNGGILFSPMHLPVLLCGIVCGPQYGLLCGLLGPVLSSMLTGMPAVAVIPTMVTELAVYGCVSGRMMRVVHTGFQLADIYVSLLSAMLSGRILAGILQAFFLAPGTYSIKLWAVSYFVSCLPAIILQLLLIPLLYAALHRAGILPGRKS